MPILPYQGVWPRIADDAFIAPTAVIVGDVTIASGASVWFGAVIRGDTASVRIGARSNVQDNCTIHTDEGAPCVVGEDCSLGHGAVVHGATLGDRVLVGMHSTVLTGAVIGSDCVLAACALVAEGKQVESGHVVMGIPGKVARPITPIERARVLSGSRHYQNYSHEYRKALAEAASPART